MLIINGHQHYPQIAEGKLTVSYINKADEFLTANGFNVKHTNVEKGYKVDEELEKFAWANFFIIQYPVY
ncbi:MAG: NAD(P)H-dependent oxidoreductase, partial [Campylobacterales bacterium]|nr:NAD(P)H-dependent oxidoreductase [Campylobacterales bacterium]